MNALLANVKFEHVVVWLPALVLGGGLLIGIFILLVRAFIESAREWGHPRLLIAGFVVLLASVVVLTWLGVSLPKE